jgi:hypothetical protein
VLKQPKVLLVKLKTAGVAQTPTSSVSTNPVDLSPAWTVVRLPADPMTASNGKLRTRPMRSSLPNWRFVFDPNMGAFIDQDCHCCCLTIRMPSCLTARTINGPNAMSK